MAGQDAARILPGSPGGVTRCCALREVTRRILARNGYEVITAVNGRDAVEVAVSREDAAQR